MTTQEIPAIKMLLEVREVAAALGCGRTYVYELIRRGELSVIKLDRLTRLLTSEVQDFVERKAAEQLSRVSGGRVVHDTGPLTPRQRSHGSRRRLR